MDLGKAIRKILWEMNYTQTELANEIGVAQTMISGYVKNKIRPSYDTLQKFDRFAKEHKIEVSLL